jgi:hypothetical protein
MSRSDRSRADALWCGTPVKIVRESDGFWIVVKFLEKCSHFAKGRTVCISDYNIVRRTPVRVKRGYR